MINGMEQRRRQGGGRQQQKRLCSYILSARAEKKMSIRYGILYQRSTIIIMMHDHDRWKYSFGNSITLQIDMKSRR